ncbi:MAG: DUF3842 family protein [Treponema sp.]|nr:DUF3842 family protein [Treponema sp.]
MKIRIVVIDGMGGGIGAALIPRLKEIAASAHSAGVEDIEIIALGANAIATERMMKAGAHRGASGENAVKRSVALGDFIVGPIGIVIANSLMGEISADMAEAVLNAPGERILLPLQNDHFHIAGFESASLAKLIDDAVAYLKKRLDTKHPS